MPEEHEGQNGTTGVSSCPLCTEQFDETDLSLEPCPCGYRVCLWCIHRLRTEADAGTVGRCPACRRAYNAEPELPPTAVQLRKEAGSLSGARFFRRKSRSTAVEKSGRAASCPAPADLAAHSTPTETAPRPAKARADATTRVSHDEDGSPSAAPSKDA